MLNAHLKLLHSLGAYCRAESGPGCRKWESGPALAQRARDRKHAETYVLKRAPRKVCATPVSVAKYQEASRKIDTVCTKKPCYKDAAHTKFTPGLCRYYEQLVTVEVPGTGYGEPSVTKFTMTAGNASLSQSQQFGAVVAPGTDQWGAWYKRASALSSHEMLALEPESGCEGFSAKIAARVKKEKLEKELAARRRAELERAEAAAAQARYEASGQREAEQICEAWNVEQLMQQQIDRDKQAEAISGVVNLTARHSPRGRSSSCEGSARRHCRVPQEDREVLQAHTVSRIGVPTRLSMKSYAEGAAWVIGKTGRVLARCPKWSLRQRPRGPWRARVLGGA